MLVLYSVLSGAWLASVNSEACQAVLEDKFGHKWGCSLELLVFMKLLFVIELIVKNARKTVVCVADVKTLPEPFSTYTPGLLGTLVMYTTARHSDEGDFIQHYLLKV